MAKSSREIKKALEKSGWLLQRQTGSHLQYKKAGNPNIVTLPHPKKDLPIGLVRDIAKKTGLKL